MLSGTGQTRRAGYHVSKDEWIAPGPCRDAFTAARCRGEMQRGWELQKDVLPGLIDPDRVPDVFVEGVASIEMAGTACLRLTFYVARDLGEGEFDRVIVARIIVPKELWDLLVLQARAVSQGLPFLPAADCGEGRVH
ncbi:MAG: hypothetical protein BGO65_12340 [Afipia sp. 64-13]|nr:MAG: hypothetical protein BGO65_12340 [Afipia sp. 64-13]